MKIATTRLLSPELEKQRCVELLPGAIAGLSTRLHLIPAKDTMVFQARPQTGHIALILKNKASLRCGESRYQITEPAVFAPPLSGAFAVTTAGDPVWVLELSLQLADADRKALEAQGNRYPYFLSYPDCTTYTEDIKSAKTINRTLVPPRLFPRLGMGSVESSGDDRVASHAHPILEQLFLGLPGNRCRVTADDQTVGFGPYELLHIPRGSMHSVEASARNGIHYVWIDIFDNLGDVDFLLQAHKP